MAKPKKISPGTSKRGYAGKLSGIMAVPVDIFFEIASHLEPLDILHLARTSKELRRLLLSRKSRHVWITARKRIAPHALPDGPASLSEPLYAALVFDHTCMACGSCALKVDYALQVRFCRSCWRKNIVQGKSSAKQALEDQCISDDFFNLLPAENRVRLYTLRYSTNALQAVVQKDTDRYYWAEFSALGKQFRHVCELRDDRAYKAFVLKCTATTLMRLNFHRMLVKWEHSRKVYQDSIVKHKLQEYGYEVTDYPSIEVDHEFHLLLIRVRRMNPLTWKNTRAKLLEHLEAERSRREAVKWQKRRDLLNRYYHLFRRGDKLGKPWDIEKRTLPNFQDAVQLPCMAALLVAAPPHVVITKHQFANIEPAIIAESQAYRARVRSDLVQIVVTRYPDKNTWDGEASSYTSVDGADVSAAQLRLLEEPTTLFCCKLCDRSMSYLGVMEHWQTIHTTIPWAARHIRHSSARSVSRLLTALDQLSRKKHSRLRRRLEYGRITCACGTRPLRDPSQTPSNYRMRRHLILDRLVKHVNSSVRTRAKHLITIEHIK